MRVHEFAKNHNLNTKWIMSSLKEINVDNPHQFKNLTIDQMNYLLKMNQERVESYINYSSLKEVKIWGIFGTQNFHYKFNESVNIFIAENGFGKTTVLNIIVAALKNDIQKLFTLPFEKVELDFEKDRYEFEKTRLKNIKIDERNFSEIRSLITTVRRYVPSDQLREITSSLQDDYFDYPAFVELFNQIKENFSPRMQKKISDELDNIIHLSMFKTKFKETNEQVFYYPTYRRVETEFKEILGRNYDTREFKDFNEMELLTDIQFGLSDVEEMLKSMTDKLKEDAISLYSKMNGEILDALLRNEINQSSSAKKVVDINNLKTIIGRIGESKIKENKKLYEFVEKGINFNVNKEFTETQVFLNYYLNKLLAIYELQLPLENRITNFIYVCNKYLVGKSFIYDSVATSVHVEKTNSQRISLSMLSSGEKQLISIFARLYLSPKKPVIFIIDEPELSLSITWQKEFLVDLYKSGNIALLISATHSPFIFDNIFDNYALEMQFS